MAESAAEALTATLMFSAAAPATIESILAAAHERSYARGARIIEEAAAGDEMFAVMDGLVKLSCLSREGGEVLFRSVGAGETFGELSALDGGPRSASAVALRPSRLLVIPGDSLRRALRADAELGASVVQTIAMALRITTRQHSDLLFLDLTSRVAAYLLDHADEHHRVELELSQGDLGGLLGATRQSVNHVLRSFEQTGLVVRRGRVLELVRPHELRSRAARPPP